MAEIFSIYAVLSLRLCHSWNNLPCIHQQFSVIASCYRPPATTISVYSYTSSCPAKEKRNSNRLGTPLSRGLRSQKGLRPLNRLQKSEQGQELIYFKTDIIFGFFIFKLVYMHTFVILVKVVEHILILDPFALIRG